MSSPDISRRSFLRGKVGTQRSVIRPPWSVSNELFIERCDRCDKCVFACPETIIHQGDGGYPEINFKKGECSFCGKCAEACATGAIQNFNLEQNSTHGNYTEVRDAWQLDVSVNAKCLSLNAVVCRACGDNCESQAINFQLKLGGISEPQINLNDCTGCGTCVHVCPVDAVQIKPKEE